MFASIDDAWGGFAARYLERMSDEHGKGCRWVFGLQQGEQTTRQRQMLRLANSAQSLYTIDPLASIHIPITSVPASLPTYLTLNGSSPWHTSALEAVAVESITLPTRLRTSEGSRATFDQMETTLNNDGHRRIASAAISVDDPSKLEDNMEVDGHHDSRMTNGLTQEDDEATETKLDIDLFPNMAGNPGRRLGRKRHTFSRIESLRGHWKSARDIESSNENSRDRFNRWTTDKYA